MGWSALALVVVGVVSAPLLVRRSLRGEAVSPARWRSPGVELILLCWLNCVYTSVGGVELLGYACGFRLGMARLVIELALHNVQLLSLVALVVTLWTTLCVAIGARLTPSPPAAATRSLTGPLGRRARDARMSRPSPEVVRCAVTTLLSVAAERRLSVSVGVSPRVHHAQSPLLGRGALDGREAPREDLGSALPSPRPVQLNGHNNTMKQGLKLGAFGRPRSFWRRSIAPEAPREAMG